MTSVLHQVAFIRWFSELGLGDVPIVGGKNASLCEMYRELVPRGVRVPNGFALTAEAYRSLSSRESTVSLSTRTRC